MRRRAVIADLAVLAGLALAGSIFGVTIVAGESMRPAMAAGDIAVYRRGSERVRTGDAVLLGAVRHAFIHRVVAVTPDGRLVTRGDANPIPDREPTSTAAVRGTVVAVVPSGTLLRRLASSAGNARLWSQSHSKR